jgi:hypothetical protein
VLAGDHRKFGQAYIADTDTPGLASSGEFLHKLPAINVVVVSDNISGAIGLLGKLVVVALGVEKERPVLLLFNIQRLR